jgi:hypothetical protein
MNGILTPSGGGKVWHEGWSRKLRVPFIGIYFYISNVRMKKRKRRDLKYQGFFKDHLIENKKKLYERQHHCCPHCGKEFDYEEMELHHILPVARYPELHLSIRNSIMLCNRCHKEVHCNPWKNIAIMKAKAQELGIDLNERYELTAECD